MEEMKQIPGTSEVMEFVSGITGSALLRIEENLPHGFVRLKVAEAERRQAQHDIRSIEDIVTELVRNSRDAGARHILVASQKEKGRFRRLAVADDGCGIPGDMHQVVFEPRVTSKRDDFTEDRYGVHGRGMALFSIRSRVPDARVVCSEEGRGCVLALTADTAAVPERSDQAGLPRLEMGVDGKIIVGPGPRNIARVLVEMSLDDKGVRYYLGSQSEVLATVIEIGRAKKQGCWREISGIRDARELATGAADLLGLTISERNAYRVINGEIVPLEPMLAGVTTPLETSRTEPAPTWSVGPRQPGGRRPTRDELEEIGEKARTAADDVLSRYYLKTSGQPKVRRGRGKITISFFVADDDESRA